MRKIIMTNGKKRAGKDYFADQLIKKGFVKLSIAKGLKDLACKIAGIDYDTMEELKNEGKSFKVNLDDFQKNFQTELRAMLSFYNNDIDIFYIINKVDEFRVWEVVDVFIDNNEIENTWVDARKFLQNMNIFKIIFNDDDIWINMVIREMQKIDEDIVLADFRFPNEYAAVAKAFDGVVSVKVIGKNLYEKDEYDNHISETSLNDWEFDYHINNTFWHSGSMFWQVQGLLQTLDLEENKDD